MITSNHSFQKSPQPSDQSDSTDWASHEAEALPDPVNTLKKFEQYAAEQCLCVWSAILNPSGIERGLLMLIALACVVAWWQCPVPAAVKLSGVGLSLTAVYFSWRYTLAIARLNWRADATWEFLRESHSTVGYTASGSYRSAFLVIIAIRSETGARTFVPIWRDSVDPAEFSALHIRLLLTPKGELR